MYEIAVSFAVTLIGIIVIPNIVVGYEHFCEFLDQRQYKKQLRTSLKADYQTWYTIAVNESDSTEKGYAIARLLIINHELNVIKGDVNRSEL